MTLPAANRPGALRPCFTAALLLAGALPAAGADWLFPASSVFYDIVANWDTPAAPGAGDAANFLGNNTGFIAWDDIVGSTSSASVLVDGATITFVNASNSTSDHTHTTIGNFIVANGGIATMGSTPLEPMFLSVGDTLDIQGTSQFVAQFGSQVTVGNDLFVGDTNGQSASATFDGAGTMLTLTDAASLGAFGSTGTLSFTNGATGNLMGDLFVADDTTANTAGVLNVTGGSVLTAANIDAGIFAVSGVSGTILVDGTGSRITQTGSSTFDLGAVSLGTGMLTLTNGGRFDTGTGTTTINATGTLDISSNGQFFGRDVQLAGTANVNNGLLFADQLQLNGGTLNTNNGSVVSVNTLTGFGNTITLNGFVTFGEPAGPTTAAHTVSAGQTFDVGQTLVVGLNRLAVFEVDGGDVTAGALRIADTTAANSSLVEVINNGTLMVNGNADIGSAAGGVGTLSVSTGGSAEFGGTLRVFTNGFVSVASSASVRANTIDTTGGGAFTAVADSTVGFNNLAGFGNTINFAGSVRTGVDVGPGGGFHTVWAGQTFTVGGRMKVGADSGAASAQFNVDGGTLDIGGFLDIGSDFAGDGRDATFRVLNGGTATNVGTSDYGSAGGATATLFVDGAGSQWDAGTARLNRGTLTVSSGGTYHTTNNFTVSAAGVVNINAGGELDVDGNFFVFGGTLNRNAGGTLDLASGRTLTASSDAEIDFTGGYDINDGRTFQINTGAGFAINTGGATFTVGRTSDGTLIADGTNTSLTLNTGGGLHEIGANGSTGTLTVRNNAEATSDSIFFDIARSSTTADTQGTLNVESGGQVTLNAISVGDLIGTLGTGTLNVTGAGSALTQNGSSSLILGNNGGTGSHTLNITDGATFTGGTGSMTLRTSGTVNLNTGGTLAANIINHANGGAFNFADGNLAVNSFNGNLVNNAGTLAPGGTPGDADTLGTTTINGDYTQNADATLALGTKGDGSHDRLVVTGHLQLAGDLVVNDDEGFFFDLGLHLDLLDFGTLGGTFDNITLFDLSIFNGLSWNTEDLYTTGEISFEREGDLNSDGFVGVEDLDILLAHWGETSHIFDFSIGDTSGDGLAGQDDLDLILANFGNGTPPGGIVPEPGSAALMGLGVLALLRRRRA